MLEQLRIASLAGIFSSSRPCLEKGLLHVDNAALSSVAKKVIIRDGFADLHDKHIIYTGQPSFYRIITWMPTWLTGIKPTNIIMDSSKQDNSDFGWCIVQVTDLEAAVILLSKTKGLTDRLSGNPEYPVGHLLLCHRGELFREQKTQYTSAHWQARRQCTQPTQIRTLFDECLVHSFQFAGVKFLC